MYPEQSYMVADDSQIDFDEYLSDLLSDFPPQSILYMAANPEFEPMIQNARHWYRREIHELLMRRGLSTVHHYVRSALSNGREFFLRVVCCVVGDPGRFSGIKVYSLGLWSTSERHLHVCLEMKVEKSHPYVVRHGEEEHISDNYMELLSSMEDEAYESEAEAARGESSTANSEREYSRAFVYSARGQPVNWELMKP